MERKSNKGLIVLVVISVLVFICSLVFICFGYTKYTELLEENRNLKATIEKADTNQEIDKEKTETQFLVRLKDVKCESDFTSECVKRVNLNYNDVDHDIMVKFDTKNLFLYEDNKLIDTIEYLPEDEHQTIDVNFDGYLYVMNDKYLGFVYQAGWRNEADINIYNNGVKKVDGISVNAGGQALSADGVKSLKGLDNIVFTKDNISYVYLSCDNENDTEAYRLELTFDGNDYKISLKETIKNVMGGGSSACYSVKKSRYGG